MKTTKCHPASYCTLHANANNDGYPALNKHIGY